jgi:hypothetical protein
LGFWRKLGKIASIAAPIVAAPFTGGASLALIGAGAGAAGGALSGGGWKGALKGAALGGATAGLGGGAGGVAAGAGKVGLKEGLKQAGKSAVMGGSKLATLGKLADLGSQGIGAMSSGTPYRTPGIASGQGTGQNNMAFKDIVGAGSRLAGLFGKGGKGRQALDLAGKFGTLAGDVDTAMHGGIDRTTRGVQAAANAKAAQDERFRVGSLIPGAVGADTGAFRNMMRASNIAGYTPNPRAQELWTKYGQSTITPGAASMRFAGDMSRNLQSRMTAGQPLTLSAQDVPGARESAFTQAAERASRGPGGVVGAIQTGSRLAGLIPQAAGVFGGGQPDEDEQFQLPGYGTRPQ